MPKIQNITAREILDSRGTPTVEAEIMLDDGTVGVGRSPSGASVGSKEALELRDGDKNRFLGKGVLKAVANIQGEIAKAVIGLQVGEQKRFDKALIECDGTEDKSRLGANAILATSIAYLSASANSAKSMICSYLNPKSDFMPVPMMNIINGGAHADNGLDLQEFMVMPVGAKSFKEALRCGAEIFHNLKAILIKEGYSTNIGDEGGFAPNIKNTNTALNLILQAIDVSGYRPGEDVVLALDAAASEFYDKTEDKYFMKEVKQHISSKELLNFYSDLVEKYPIFSIEDSMSEYDIEGWKNISNKFNSSMQLVGDDVFVTNLDILKKLSRQSIANSILIKPNQIGTITETLDVIKYAQEHGYKCVLSHRSGETEDVLISHLAVATNSKQIKTGSLCRVDRTAKYNELLRIEDRLSPHIKYPSLF